MELRLTGQEVKEEKDSQEVEAQHANKVLSHARQEGRSIESGSGCLQRREGQIGERIQKHQLSTSPTRVINLY